MLYNCFSFGGCNWCGGGGGGGGGVNIYTTKPSPVLKHFRCPALVTTTTNNTAPIPQISPYSSSIHHTKPQPPSPHLSVTTISTITTFPPNQTTQQPLTPHPQITIITPPHTITILIHPHHTITSTSPPQSTTPPPPSRISLSTLGFKSCCRWREVKASLLSCVCFSLISSAAERGLLVSPWNYSDGEEEEENGWWNELKWLGGFCST